MNTQDIIKKYGEPGAHQVYCTLPYRMKLAWQPDVTIGRFSCHETIREDLENIFQEVLDCYGSHGVTELGLDLFGGCLNIRKKMGGTSLSVHSWGLAVDLDPLHNKLHWGKDRAKFATAPYHTFWEIVEKHGGFSLGRIKDYDWMHFQFVPIN